MGGCSYFYSIFSKFYMRGSPCTTLFPKIPKKLLNNESNRAACPMQHPGGVLGTCWELVIRGGPEIRGSSGSMTSGPYPITYRVNILYDILIVCMRMSIEGAQFDCKVISIFAVSILRLLHSSKVPFRFLG